MDVVGLTMGGEAVVHEAPASTSSHNTPKLLHHLNVATLKVRNVSTYYTSSGPRTKYWSAELGLILGWASMSRSDEFLSLIAINAATGAIATAPSNYSDLSFASKWIADRGALFLFRFLLEKGGEGRSRRGDQGSSGGVWKG